MKKIWSFILNFATMQPANFQYRDGRELGDCMLTVNSELAGREWGEYAWGLGGLGGRGHSPLPPSMKKMWSDGRELGDVHVPHFRWPLLTSSPQILCLFSSSFLLIVVSSSLPLIRPERCTGTWLWTSNWRYRIFARADSCFETLIYPFRFLMRNGIRLRTMREGVAFKRGDLIMLIYPFRFLLMSFLNDYCLHNIKKIHAEVIQ